MLPVTVSVALSTPTTEGEKVTWMLQLAPGAIVELDRLASEPLDVLVNGVRAALAGRVSMDMIGIDVTDLDAPARGDAVILWGEGLPVEEIARRSGTIPYELLCGISQRVAVELR